MQPFLEGLQMSKTLSDLLAIDGMASRYGCGLNPKLKQAIQADLRFPAAAASPLPDESDLKGPLPANVTRLTPKHSSAKRKQA